jgi:hypothetical protein
VNDEGSSKKFRFSLLALMGLVLLAALGCAALRYASPVWASCLFTVGLISVLFSGTAAFCAEPMSRPFWIGATLCGGGYLLWAFWLDATVGPPLANTMLAAYLEPRLHLAGRDTVWFNSPPEGLRPGKTGPREFRQVANCLAAFVVGLVGGTLARALFCSPRTKTAGEGGDMV